MNKLKFLGSTLMAAFFAFGLASCEKENFNTKVETDVNTPSIEIPGVTLPEGYKPGDAVISIQPTVWAVIDGDIQNVTALSKLSFNGVEKPTYTESSANGFAAMTVKIVATYDAKVGEETKTLTAETSIQVPALTAGQVAIFTPTLVMSAKSPEQGGDGPDGPDGPGGDGKDYAYMLNPTGTTTTEETTGYFEIKNTSSYYYYYSQGVFEDAVTREVEWDAENSIHQAGVDQLEDLYASVYKDEVKDVIVGTPLFYVYSNSITRINVDVLITKTVYNIEASVVSRSASSVGTLTVRDYTYIYDSTEYFNIDGGHGHGHGHGNGHGHDHGHGGSNAGGGIVNSL